MRPTKSQFITRIRKAQSRLATIKESPRCYNDFGPSDKSHLISHKHGAVVNDSDSSLIEIRSNRANTFLEQKNEDGLVRQILTYNNYTRALQSRQTLEYDEQGRIIHSVETGEYWFEEMVSIKAEDINITHTLKHYNEIGKDDEFIIMVDDSKNCVEATYSYTTGILLNICQIFPDRDYFADIDFCEDGTIREYRIERLSE